MVSGGQPGSYLGPTELNRVYFDHDAADDGRFVDPTPAGNEELRPTPSSHTLKAVDPRAVDRIDLLTVAERELGHVAGFDDLDAVANNLTSGLLDASVRCNPFLDHLDAVLAGE